MKRTQMNITRIKSVVIGLAVAGLTATSAYAATPTPTPTPAAIALPTLTGVSATWSTKTGFIVDWVPLDSKYSSRVKSFTVTASNGAICTVGGWSNNECVYSNSFVPFPFKPFIAYTFKVTANGAEGAGPISAPSNPAGWYGAPNYSTVVTATTLSDTSIQVNWVPDPGTGGVPLTGFKVYYWPLNKDNLQKVASSTDYSTVLTGLTPSTWYVISLTTCNYYGCSASDWVFKATSPYTTSVTTTKLPTMINGGSAATTCFDAVLNGGSPSSTSATKTKNPTPCPTPAAPAKPWAPVVPTATTDPNGPIATKFAQHAWFTFDAGYAYSMSYKWNDQGLARFTSSRSLAPRVYTSLTPAVCSIVNSPTAGWSAHFLAPGTCTISLSIPADATYNAAGPFLSSMKVNP